MSSEAKVEFINYLIDYRTDPQLFNGPTVKKVDTNFISYRWNKLISKKDTLGIEVLISIYPGFPPKIYLYGREDQWVKIYTTRKKIRTDF